MKTKRRPAVWVTSALVLQVRNLAIDVAARRVLSDASFTVAAGDKVGLVGRNGAGKTSLLKVLAEENDPAAPSKKGPPACKSCTGSSRPIIPRLRSSASPRRRNASGSMAATQANRM